MFGQQKFAVRVAVDPDAAAARGLTLDNVSNAVAAANSSTPVGALLGKRQNVTRRRHRPDGPRRRIRQPRRRLAQRRAGPAEGDRATSTIRSRTIRSPPGSATTAAIVLAVYRQSDANTVDVVDDVKAQAFPTTSRNCRRRSRRRCSTTARSRSASRSSDVQFTLLLSIALVVIVIFVFLKSASATLIPALALPVSLIGACAFMYVFGYSIDNISLLAITLSVGFVVDDAIVMLENITRHIEERHEAVRRGAEGLERDRASPSCRSPSRWCAVFIPVLLMGGVVGRVFREFAVTHHRRDPRLRLRFADADADAVRAHLSARPSTARTRACSRASPTLFVDGLLDGYRVTLDRRAEVPARSCCSSLSRPSIVAYLALRRLPKGFFPDEDTGFLRGITEAQPDTSFPRHGAAADRVATWSPRIRRSSTSLRRPASAARPTRASCSSCSSTRPTAATVDQIMRACAARRAGLPRHPHQSCSRCRTSNSPAAASRAPNINTRCSPATSTRSTRMRRRWTRDRATAAAARRQHRPADHQSADPRRHRPRQGGGLRHYDRPGPQRALQRLWHAADFDDLHARPTTTRSFSRRPRISRTTPTRSAASASRRPRGQLVPLDEVATMRRTVGPLQSTGSRSSRP